MLGKYVFMLEMCDYKKDVNKVLSLLQKDKMISKEDVAFFKKVYLKEFMKEKFNEEYVEENDV